jgi:hypothetical protein
MRIGNVDVDRAGETSELLRRLRGYRDRPLARCRASASDDPSVLTPNFCAPRKVDDGVDALARDAECDGELDVTSAEEVDEGADSFRGECPQPFREAVSVREGATPRERRNSALSSLAMPMTRTPARRASWTASDPRRPPRR